MKGKSPRQAQHERDAVADEAARDELLRLDADRSVGENLEQADALIRAAFELARGLPAEQG